MLSPVFVIIASTTLFGYNVLAQDDECASQYCNPISSLLTKCNLPALSTPYKTYDNLVLRNVSQAPDFTSGLLSFHVGGPQTYIIEDYNSAACLCGADINNVYDCTSCDISTEDGSPEENRGEMSSKYFNDCLEFGYYANSTQGFPTTTHTALPSATAPASQKMQGCSPCDVIADQLTQCNSTDPTGSRYPPLTEDVPIQGVSFSDGTAIQRWNLMNRTMGECVCTLPVLRRFAACKTCGGALVGGTIEYELDCEDLGYFSDAKVVLPPGVNADGSLVSTSTVDQLPTSTPTPSPTGNSAAGQILQASNTLIWTIKYVGLAGLLLY